MLCNTGVTVSNNNYDCIYKYNKTNNNIVIIVIIIVVVDS